MAPAPATVFVVDDDPQVREAIALLLESVSLHVETFESAMAFLDAYRPDRAGCLVLDLMMPQISGLEFHRQLIERGIRIPTIILTAYAEVSVAVEAMRLGAVDLIEKPHRPQALLECIHRALAIDKRVRERATRVAGLQLRFESLSPREFAVVELLAGGRNTKRIAIKLDIAPATVDFHRRNAMAKLQVESLVELGRIYEGYSRAHQQSAHSMED